MLCDAAKVYPDILKSNLCSNGPMTRNIPGCRDGCGDSHGYGYGMRIGTVINPHGAVGILLRFSSGCEIKRKRVEHAINVVVAV